MQAGDCFFGRLPRSGSEKHFWIILISPNKSGDIALVNLTTPRRQTMAQILKKTTLPVLEYDSVVKWDSAAVFKAEHVQKAIDCGAFKSHPGLTANNLAEMIAEGEFKGLIPTDILAKIKGK